MAKNRHALAAVAALAAFGAVLASAATLGGISSQGLGSDTTTVASCHTAADADIVVAYTTAYNAVSGEYDVTGVTLSSINPSCDGKPVKVTLTNAFASLVEYSGTVTGTGVTLTGGTAQADSVDHAAIVIAG